MVDAPDDASRWSWINPDGKTITGAKGELMLALRSERLPASTLVWRAGWAEWLAASRVTELKSVLPPGKAEPAQAPKLTPPRNASRRVEGPLGGHSRTQGHRHLPAATGTRPLGGRQVAASARTGSLRGRQVASRRRRPSVPTSRSRNRLPRGGTTCRVPTSRARVSRPPRARSRPLRGRAASARARASSVHRAIRCRGIRWAVAGRRARRSTRSGSKKSRAARRAP
jgi:hypothetical protein